MDAFDADVLIYAAARGHELGARVRPLLQPGVGGRPSEPAGIGSVLLLPELLSQPMRDRAHEEVVELALLLTRLDLRPVDGAVAELATTLAATYRLRAADAAHLATAVSAGADCFITNNRRDFPTTITEIDITYPADL